MSTIPIYPIVVNMTLRPEVDKKLVEQIKIKYPKETGMLSPAKTVEWALRKALGVQ